MTIPPAVPAGVVVVVVHPLPRCCCCPHRGGGGGTPTVPAAMVVVVVHLLCLPHCRCGGAPDPAVVITVVGIIDVAGSCWVTGVDGAGGGALWWGSVIKKERGGCIPVHRAALHRHRRCPRRCPARYPAQPVIACSLWSLVVMVVVVVVVGWVVWVERNECVSGLGDVACHVIQVGTCCSNRHDFMWAGGSAVKHALLRPQEVGCLNLQKNKCFFAPN